MPYMVSLRTVPLEDSAELICTLLKVRMKNESAKRELLKFAAGGALMYNSPAAVSKSLKDEGFPLEELSLRRAQDWAKRNLSGGEKIIGEHAVPVSKVTDYLLENPKMTKEDVLAVLQKCAKFCFIKKSENDSLNENHLSQELPDNITVAEILKDENKAFNRYKKAGISICKRT